MHTRILKDLQRAEKNKILFAHYLLTLAKWVSHNPHVPAFKSEVSIWSLDHFIYKSLHVFHSLLSEASFAKIGSIKIF
jgi:hypothetical protein